MGDTENLLVSEFYKEHFTHARHLEAQRTLISAASLGASGKLMLEIFSRFHNPQSPPAWPYAVALLALNLLTWLLSRKLYELFKLHMTMSEMLRNKQNGVLLNIRKDAERENRTIFRRWRDIELHVIWESVFQAIMIFSGAICILEWKPGLRSWILNMAGSLVGIRITWLVYKLNKQFKTEEKQQAVPQKSKATHV